MGGQEDVVKGGIDREILSRGGGQGDCQQWRVWTLDRKRLPNWGTGRYCQMGKEGEIVKLWS